MSCNRPLKAFPYGTTTKGKPNYVICSYEVKRLEIRKGKIFKTSSDIPSPESEKIINTYVEIPCGQCLDCKLSHAREWSTRIQMEASKYKNNCFVTLTYNGENLPMSKRIVSVNDETGETIIDRNGPFNSLYINDLQNFIKKLREYLFRDEVKKLKEKYHYKRGDKELLSLIKKQARENVGVRFFACGEYGSKGRAHYHLILFNYKPNDLEFHDTNEVGDILYTSEFLSKIWKKGFVIIGEVTEQSAGYVARYSMKKLTQEKNNSLFFEENGIDKEFITMSLKPGIGRDYYSESLFNDEHIFLPSKKGARSCKPPRYFKKILEEENPIKSELVRKKNKYYQDFKKKILINASDLSYIEQLERKESNLKRRTKALKERRIA